MIQFLVIIPARYASVRFPGKALAQIDGKPMVQHVYKRCCEVFDQVVIATDDQRIASAIEAFGGEFVMTSKNHPSGTDRCAEAASLLESVKTFDVVVNVQGDEPFIATEQLLEIKKCFEDQRTHIATLITQIVNPQVLFDPNKVKTITDKEGFALYFSRQALPFLRDVPADQWLEHHDYFLHLGIYAFRKETLQQLVSFSPSSLEKAEKLEQLRWLENGFHIKTARTQYHSIGVDTPEDLELIRARVG